MELRGVHLLVHALLARGLHRRRHRHHRRGCQGGGAGRVHGCRVVHIRGDDPGGPERVQVAQVRLRGGGGRGVERPPPAAHHVRGPRGGHQGAVAHPVRQAERGRVAVQRLRGPRGHVPRRGVPLHRAARGRQHHRRPPHPHGHGAVPWRHLQDLPRADRGLLHHLLLRVPLAHRGRVRHRRVVCQRRDGERAHGAPGRRVHHLRPHLGLPARQRVHLHRQADADLHAPRVPRAAHRHRGDRDIPREPRRAHARPGLHAPDDLRHHLQVAPEHRGLLRGRDHRHHQAHGHRGQRPQPHLRRHGLRHGRAVHHLEPHAHPPRDQRDDHAPRQPAPPRCGAAHPQPSQLQARQQRQPGRRRSAVRQQRGHHEGGGAPHGRRQPRGGGERPHHRGRHPRVPRQGVPRGVRGDLRQRHGGRGVEHPPARHDGVGGLHGLLLAGVRGAGGHRLHLPVPHLRQGRHLGLGLHVVRRGPHAHLRRGRLRPLQRAQGALLHGVLRGGHLVAVHRGVRAHIQVPRRLPEPMVPGDRDRRHGAGARGGGFRALPAALRVHHGGQFPHHQSHRGRLGHLLGPRGQRLLRQHDRLPPRERGAPRARGGIRDHRPGRHYGGGGHVRQLGDLLLRGGYHGRLLHAHQVQVAQVPPRVQERRGAVRGRRVDLALPDVPRRRPERVVGQRGGAHGGRHVVVHRARGRRVHLEEGRPRGRRRRLQLEPAPLHLARGARGGGCEQRGGPGGQHAHPLVRRLHGGARRHRGDRDAPQREELPVEEGPVQHGGGPQRRQHHQHSRGRARVRRRGQRQRGLRGRRRRRHPQHQGPPRELRRVVRGRVHLRGLAHPPRGRRVGAVLHRLGLERGGPLLRARQDHHPPRAQRRGLRHLRRHERVRRG
mmetsp:Transcript_30714/g.98089  ORF Transcript_30714/g.98089 Transcript_30714/m.98089 type:complete len:884 (-) Transcript_30714:1121-3772(-)